VPAIVAQLAGSMTGTATPPLACPFGPNWTALPSRNAQPIAPQSSACWERERYEISAADPPSPR